MENIMAVRVRQYTEEFEKKYAKTGSATKAHKVAAKKSKLKHKIKKQKEDPISKLKRKIHMILRGEKYQTPTALKHRRGLVGRKSK